MEQIDWQMVATIVTALATGVLAWVTWVLVQETKRLADATTRPHVVAPPRAKSVGDHVH